LNNRLKDKTTIDGKKNIWKEGVLKEFLEKEIKSLKIEEKKIKAEWIECNKKIKNLKTKLNKEKECHI